MHTVVALVQLSRECAGSREARTGPELRDAVYV